MERERTWLSDEEYIKKKQELASERGAYVVKSNTLESKYMLVRLREYDRLLSWIKMHIGVDIDTQEALNMIEQCKNADNQFTETLNKLRKFVAANTKPYPHRTKTVATSGDNGKTEDDSIEK